MNTDFSVLENNIKYTFKDRALLKQALIHPSYSSEAGMERYLSNQRLEFLGDAVLELAVSDFLYHEHPGEEEGELTRKRSSLVFEAALCVCAKKINLGDFILLGIGENSSKGYEKPSILSDAFEALIGAIYIDGGYDEARLFIDRFVIGSIDEMSLLHDGKSIIQKYVQKTPGDTIRYVTKSAGKAEGSDGFKAWLYINDKLVTEGFGQSKKQAEQDAALKACKRLNIR